MKLDSEQFIHLKVRSHYSILEGSMKIEDIVSAAEESKMPAILLTDNSNVFGAMEFTKLCLNKGIQPIIGCILNIRNSENAKNFEDHFHESNFSITLLVKNIIGWENLSTLISKAYYNYKTIGKKSVNLDDLSKNSQGLICLFNELVQVTKGDIKKLSQIINL